MNQWRVKRDKNVFKLAYRFNAFPKMHEMLETDTRNIHVSAQPLN